MCARCGTGNEPTEAFCGQCGAVLGAPGTVLAPSSTKTPEGERRQLSVMFCDLVGSTELAARMDPEDWRQLLERYQHVAGDVVARLGGHVAKFLGDGLLIYFGWPRAHDDDVARAVRAGLMLTEAIGALPASRDTGRLGARIAVHTGEVVVGPDGEIFGDAPHVSARAQAIAAPGTVVITGATERLLRGRFETETLGAHALKGVPEPLALHRVTRLRPVTWRSRPRDDAAAFVGREPEMALLREAWADVDRGHGRVVVVVGEPGIGKSRLVRHFAHDLGDARHNWVDSTCSPYHQHTPFFPVADVLRQGFEWRGDETAAQRLRSLERSAIACDLDPDEAVPVVARLLGVAVPDGAAPARTPRPQQQRRRLLATLVAWTLGAARRRPLVIALEDLQWIDPSTLELHTLLVEQAAAAPLLLLYTARSEFPVPWPARPHHTRIALSRLDVGEARCLAGQLGTLPRHVIDAIVARTDGVPLFVEELTKAVLERQPAALADVPASIQGLLTARLDRLGPEKQVAQLASVVGREFSRELLRSLGAARGAALEATLRRLVDAGIVHECSGRPDDFAFKHVLVQEAAYASLLRSRRRQLHGRVARALEARADRAAVHPELLARHYAGAGEVDLAIEHYRRAGEQAMRQWAHAEAIEHFSAAISLVPDVADARRRVDLEADLQIALGAPLVATRGYGSPDVERAHRRAYELCGELGGGPALHQALSGLFLFHQAHAELQPAATRAGELLALGERERDDFVVQWGCFFSSVPCYYRGEYRAALDFLVRGIGLHDPSAPVGTGYVHEHDAGLSLLCYAAMTGWTLGDADGARAWLQRALELGRQSGHPFKLAFVQSFATLVHFLCREPERVRASAADAVRICTEQDFPVYLGLALMCDGWATAHLGDPERGLETVRRGLGVAATAETRIEAPRGLGLLAEILLLLGRADDALDAITAGLTIAERTDSHYWDAELLRLRGMALAGAGLATRDEALDCLRRARAVARAQAARALELRAALSEAETLRRRGDRLAAEGLVAPLYASFGSGHDLPDLRAARDLLETRNGTTSPSAGRRVEP